MKKILNCIFLLCLSVLTACGVSAVADSDWKLADMSGYTYLTEENEVFLTSSLSQVKEKKDNGETFAVYFGFDTCPYCNQFMPIFHSFMLSENLYCDYVDTNAPTVEGSEESAFMVDDVGKLGENLLTEDDEGNTHFYVPCVMVFRNGSLIYFADAEKCYNDPVGVAQNTISILKGIDIKNE